MMLAWTIIVSCYILLGKCDGNSLYETDYATIEDRIDSTLGHSIPTSKCEKWDLLLQEDGSFSDLDYSKDGESEKLLEHSRRLENLIRCDLIDDDSHLSEKTKECFIYLTYEVPKPTSARWWLHLIGVPTKVWPLIFRTRNEFNDTVKSDFFDKFFTNVKNGPVWRPSQRDSGKNAGGNLAPRFFVGLVEYCLRRKLPEFHKEAKIILRDELIDRNPFGGNGMRQDGCLHQHSKNFIKKNPDGSSETVILGQIYNHAYGKEILKNIPLSAWLLDGTAFDLGEEIEESVFNTFLECHQWLYRGKTVEPVGAGRKIDSGRLISTEGGKTGVLVPLKYLNKLAQHKAEIASAVHRYYNVIPDKEFALEGNRYFFVSDLTAHQRRSFMASLRVLSRRTNRPETIPPQGYSAAYYKGTAEGYYLGDGWLTVLVTGKELGSFDKEVFQVYDWARIPGATIQYTTDIPQVSTTGGNVDPKHLYNDEDFVGGVTNKKEGLTAMIYNRATVSLKAKKSWFFFDNVIFCLGSGMSLPEDKITTNSVTTTLNQVIYEGMHYVGDKTAEDPHTFDEAVDGKLTKDYDLIDGLWFHHGSIGYVPIINTGKISLEVEEKVIKGTETFLKKFSLWLDHGTKPFDSVYAYAVLPAQSLSQTKEFSNHHTAKILSLDNSRHAACSETLKILGIVFYDEGCMTINTCLATGLDSVCTDEPALVMLKDLGSEPSIGDDCPDGVTELDIYSLNEVLPTQTLQISVAEPTQKLSKINLTFKKGNSVYPIPVTTTPPPKAGSSVIMCLRLS